MKKWKIPFLAFVCFLTFWLAGECRTAKAEATQSFNLIQTMSTQYQQPGKWVRKAKGYRFRYTATKTYAKNTWLKVNGKIYYVNKKGYRVDGFKTYKKNKYYLNGKTGLVTGWQNIDGEKYYFSKKTGACLKGWNKIGAKRYYFNKRGVLQTNKWIKSEYVGKKGYQLAGKRIFVGDSRTVGLQKAVGGTDIFIAKWGQGYQWFSSTAVRSLNKELKENPYSAVILCLGINDLKNVDSYLLLYQDLVSAYPKARFYFLSVNPVEEIYFEECDNGLYLDTKKNEKVEEFNDKLRAAFPLAYIDSYHWLLSQGYVEDLPGGVGTVDGLHYMDSVYQVLYRYVIARAK